ncbi:hypothetical protein LCGC14_2997430 [marine sediment metagenome]|uniref:Uncharacterized protein n=1 Tax=marine sediment metagenome TaxID=412755 RepID=A0A0F8X203_9ZZZZ
MTKRAKLIYWAALMFGYVFIIFTFCSFMIYVLAMLIMEVAP